MSPDKLNTKVARPNDIHLTFQGRRGGTTFIAPRRTEQHRERLLRILNEALELLGDSDSSWGSDHEDRPLEDTFKHQKHQP